MSAVMRVLYSGSPYHLNVYSMSFVQRLFSMGLFNTRRIVLRVLRLRHMSSTPFSFEPQHRLRQLLSPVEIDLKCWVSIIVAVKIANMLPTLGKLDIAQEILISVKVSSVSGVQWNARIAANLFSSVR